MIGIVSVKSAPILPLTLVDMEHSAGFLAVVAARSQYVKEMSVAEARDALERTPAARLIDVREDREWESGHAEGAEHISRGVLERDIEKLIPDPDTPLFLYCGGGYRSILAAASLAEMGYSRVVSIQGGWRAWKEAGAPESY